ncbi:4'-phosphopantetheinyl transferase family protein [Streptacidiphilus cavernicola]|uniref:4'-phosphopantetheinyl transferase superfamily protein n=1 Tax=Streptacidiphilus cavernicola TaxID=3342716 RepID=A0ABV6W1N8_9ACTN
MTAAPTSVDFWTVRADQPAPVAAVLRRLLDRTERERADAAADPVLADRFTVVHGAVRLLTAERLGIAAADLVWRYGPHGKPEPEQDRNRGRTLRLSYSGSGPLAVLALAEDRRVGADVEELRDERVAARMAGRYFPEADRRWIAEAGSAAGASDRFTRLWCRREAVVKAYGGRLAQGLGLRLGGAAPVRLAEAGSLDAGACLVSDVPVPEPFRAAVAAEGDRPFQVVRWSWPDDFPAFNELLLDSSIRGRKTRYDDPSINAARG